MCSPLIWRLRCSASSGAAHQHANSPVLASTWPRCSTFTVQLLADAASQLVERPKATENLSCMYTRAARKTARGRCRRRAPSLLVRTAGWSKLATCIVDPGRSLRGALELMHKASAQLDKSFHAQQHTSPGSALPSWAQRRNVQSLWSADLCAGSGRTHAGPHGSTSAESIAWRRLPPATAASATTSSCAVLRHGCRRYLYAHASTVHHIMQSESCTWHPCTPHVQRYQLQACVLWYRINSARRGQPVLRPDACLSAMSAIVQQLPVCRCGPPLPPHQSLHLARERCAAKGCTDICECRGSNTAESLSCAVQDVCRTAAWNVLTSEADICMHAPAHAHR